MRLTRGLAAPLAALASPNPALSVTALAVTGRAGGHLAAASAVPGAGFASRGIVSRPAPAACSSRWRCSALTSSSPFLAAALLSVVLPQASAASPCTVSRDDMPSLVAEIRYAHSDTAVGASVDSTFASCSIIRSDTIMGALYGSYFPYAEARHGKPLPGETVSLFVPHVRESVLFHPVSSSELMCMFHDHLGFERVVNVLTVWQEVDGRLALYGVLDRSIDTAIGYAWIDTLVATRSRDTLIIKGRSAGGDGGGYWQSVWFGYWQRPFHFDLLYSKRCEKPDSDDLLEVALDDEFDAPSGRALISIRTRRGTADPWSVAERDTVYIDSLIASMKGRK